METILDHNPTPQELRDLIADENPDREGILNAGLTQVQWYSLIYSHYMLRKNKEKAYEYANKIPDTTDKWFGLLNHDH